MQQRRGVLRRAHLGDRPGGLELGARGELLRVLHGLRSFTPRIIDSGGGHIVNTASMAGPHSPPGMSPYNVSKHAVVTLSESMSVELSMAHPEVGISVLCPGWVRPASTRPTATARVTRPRRGRPAGTRGHAGSRGGPDRGRARPCGGGGPGGHCGQGASGRGSSPIRTGWRWSRVAPSDRRRRATSVSFLPGTMDSGS